MCREATGDKGKGCREIKQYTETQGENVSYLFFKVPVITPK
jgi:hypothetical protein